MNATLASPLETQRANVAVLREAFAVASDAYRAEPTKERLHARVQAYVAFSSAAWEAGEMNRRELGANRNRSSKS